MTTTSPRQRLADAVAALDGYDDSNDESGLAVVPSAARLAVEDEVFAAARALLAAPDDAAELAAVKALGETPFPLADGHWAVAGPCKGGWYWEEFAVNENTNETYCVKSIRALTALTAVALCAKLGVKP
jgi:hypothetical protein